MISSPSADKEGPEAVGETCKCFILCGERGRNRTYNLLIKRAGLSSPFSLIRDFSYSCRFNKMRKGGPGGMRPKRHTLLLTKLLTRKWSRFTY